MQRYILILREELFGRMQRLNALTLNLVVGYEEVECSYLHAEALGYASHVAAHLTESVDA